MLNVEIFIQKSVSCFIAWHKSLQQREAVIKLSIHTNRTCTFIMLLARFITVYDIYSCSGFSGKFRSHNTLIHKERQKKIFPFPLSYVKLNLLLIVYRRKQLPCILFKFKRISQLLRTESECQPTLINVISVFNNEHNITQIELDDTFVIILWRRVSLP